mmetsp:Transcript_4406/g.9631  ORF Transcript_4406/g.9631 Transcript_4406/m.9631 type:complete len:240 (+) Transcript_4406:305-1024(+)
MRNTLKVRSMSALCHFSFTLHVYFDLDVILTEQLRSFWSFGSQAIVDAKGVSPGALDAILSTVSGRHDLHRPVESHLDLVEHLVNLRLVNCEWRAESERVAGQRTDDQPEVERSAGDGGGDADGRREVALGLLVGHELDRTDQPHPTRLAHERVRAKPLHSRLHVWAQTVVHARNEPIALDDLDHLEGDRARDRVTRVGVAVAEDAPVGAVGAADRLVKVLGYDARGERDVTAGQLLGA